MAKFIKIKNSLTHAQPHETYISENSFRGINYTKTLFYTYFDGLGELNAGNAVLFNINNESGEQICEAIAKAISSSTSNIITIFDATTGEKIHTDLDNIAIFVK